MKYHVVFDIATVGYKNWEFPVYGLLLTAIIVGIFIYRKQLPGWQNKRSDKITFSCLVSFSMFWTVLMFFQTYCEYQALVDAVAKKQVNQVTGKVTEFKAKQAQSKGAEKFCVDSTCFEYSNSRITAGFNQIRADGGPIYQGLPVRITYLGNTIVKLEVAD